MKDEVVEKLNAQKCIQGTVLLKVLYYNPSDSVFLHLPVGEEIEKTEINRLKDGYIIDTLTNVASRENFILGVKEKKSTRW